MSPSAYSQGFGRRRRSLSLGRYDDERFYDQSFGRDSYDEKGSDRYFGRRRFGRRDMNRFDDNCYDERYGSSFDEDRFDGNRSYSRRRSQSLGRRNSMARRYSVGCYDNVGPNEAFSGYFDRRPFGMNSMNRFDGGRLMNRYPDYRYFGYNGWYPRYNRFGFDRIDDYNYDNDNFDSYRYAY